MRSCGKMSYRLVNRSPMALCNIRCPSKMHPKQKSVDISLVYNLSCNFSIILKFGTWHDNITAVSCEQFQYNCTTETVVMDEQILSRCVCLVKFWQVAHSAQPPRPGLAPMYSRLPILYKTVKLPKKSIVMNQSARCPFYMIKWTAHKIWSKLSPTYFQTVTGKTQN